MKRKIGKYIVGTLLAVVLLPSAYTVVYYFLEIVPQTDSINMMIESYNDRSKNYQIMEKMTVKEEGINGIHRYVSHSLAVTNIAKGFCNYWHLIGLHWHLWVWLKYSEEEEYSLWLAMAPYGPGRGMKQASIYHFNKPFEELSCYQLAELVVMVRAPTRFIPGSERSKQRIYERGVANECGS